MIHADHDCAWTRRRRSMLWRRDGAVGGAGLPRAVLEHVARRLVAALEEVAPAAAEAPDGAVPDEHTVAFRVGEWRATLHDGCFLAVEGDTPALRAAVVDGVLALHAGYAGGEVPARAAELVGSLLAEGVELDVRSDRGRAAIALRAHPIGASWWRRMRATVHRIAVSRGA